MVKQYQLKNGLRVLTIQSHKSPVVTMQAWVRTGSADETPKEAGLSHFIEHLLFKGTRKFKVGEIAQVIEGSGGELNAYTSFDQTVFYMTLSKQFMSTGLETLSDMMGFPAFDHSEIDAEREVVIEEMRRGHDSLGRQASQMLFSSAYAKHPYGRPVIGYEDIIRKIKPKVIESYFQGRYNPKNMFLVLSGDFEAKEAKTMIESFFGELPIYPVRKVKRAKVARIAKQKIKVEKSKFEQSIAYLSWPVPKISHVDIPALDLLAFILGAGETSRLVNRLRMKEPLVQSIGASTFTPKDEGLFLISLSYSAEADPKKIFPAVTDEMLRILSEDITTEEIQRAVTNMQSDEFYSLETVDGLARKYGHLEFYFQDIGMSERYLKKMRSLNAADLRKVFKKYIKPETAILSALVASDKKVVETSLKIFLKDLKKGLAIKPGTKLKSPTIKHMAVPKFKKAQSQTPEVELIELSNGDRVLFRPSFDTPVVSVRVATLGGIRTEPAAQAGMVELVSRTWMGGTAKYSEEQLSQMIEGMAAGLGPSSGRNSISLSLDVLASSSHKVQNVWQEVLSNPTFPIDVIQRERQMQLNQIKSKKDNPAQICMNLFSQAMFGSHPYSRDALGSAATLEPLQSSDLNSWWKQNFLQRKKTIAICGATEAESWIKSWEEASKSSPKSASVPPDQKISYPKSEVHVFEKLEKEQSHLVCGYPGLTLHDGRRYALQIMQSVLAGQGGRLFLELRDKNSLAYSVSPLRMEGIDGGYFGAYIGCAPNKVDLALSMMREQFDRLRTELIPPDELERAKRYIVGRHDIDLQRSSALSSAILFNDLYGIDYNEAFNSADKYWSVTAEEVRKLADEIFGPSPVVSVVGPHPLKVVG